MNCSKGISEVKTATGGNGTGGTIGSPSGNGNFNLANFNAAEASGGKWFYWSVDNQILTKKEKVI